MGFECGFNKVKKKSSLTPYETFISIYNSTWYYDTERREYYPTFKEYFNQCFSYLGNNVEDLKYMPTQDDIDFYKNHNEENIEFWCSVGRYIDDFIVENTDEIKPFEYYVVTYEFIDRALEWVDSELNDLSLVKVYPVKGIRTIKDDEEAMYPIDSIMVEDENGYKRIIDCEYDCLYAPKNEFFDEDKKYTFESFKEVLLKLKEIDLNEYLVYYYRSY